MNGDNPRLREEVACAARAFAALGFVHAFGHVSARLASTLLITPTRPPLATQRAADILETDFEGLVISGTADATSHRGVSAYWNLSGARRRRRHLPHACAGGVAVAWRIGSTHRSMVSAASPRMLRLTMGST